MTTNSNSTESNQASTIPTPPTTSGYVAPAPVAVVDDAQVEDFGYDDIPEDKPVVPPVEPPKVVVAPVEDPEKIEKSATGYGKEAAPAVVEPPKADVPPVDDTPEKIQLKKDLEESLKDLPKSIDKEKVTKFMSDNGFTKEQAKAYADLSKSEATAFEKSQADAVKLQRKQWSEELSADPDFGGEHFDKNVHQVEKVLEKHMPGMKKALTERGTMLPPYLMKDLLALSRTLNPVTKLVVGDSNEVKAESNFLDDMYN